MSDKGILLEEVFDIERGGSPRPIQHYLTDDPSGVPWIMIGDTRVGGKYIETTKSRIKKEGILRSREVFPGELLLSNSMSFGRPYILKTYGCIHDGWLVLRPKRNDIDIDYAYHALGSTHAMAQFQKQAAGATVKNLNKDIVASTKIPLPPLEEQRRIAAILDKANRLRQLNHANLQSLDAIERKVFSDMFGDPVSNDRGWDSGCIGDFVAHFETGKSLGSGDGDVSGSLRIIRVSSVSSGTFKPEESKPAPKGYIPQDNHFVQEGDLLFCRANTDLLIGEVAYVGQVVRGLLLSDKIWRFCWADNSISCAFYVQQLFRHPSIRREIRRRATGTSGSMLNISQSSVLEIPVILPPADFQSRFQAIAAECRRLYSQNTSQAKSLLLLSYSLNTSFLEHQ